MNWIPERLRVAWHLLRGTWDRYQDARGSLMSAGLALFGMMSAAPLALLAVMFTSVVSSRAQARETLVELLRRASAPSIGPTVLAVLDRMREGLDGRFTALVIVLLGWAASRLFVHLQDALNVMWGVEVEDADSTPELIRRVVIKRLWSFLMVMAVGVSLLALVSLQFFVSGLTAWVARALQTFGLPLPALVAPQLALSLSLMTCFFAALYRVLPDARIPWRDVWVGAACTTVAMVVGTIPLSLYLPRVAGDAIYGALGTLAGLIVWAYYLAQVFMLGAAFTRTWAEYSDGGVRPEQHAHLV